jgi:hypothetical protein
MGSSEGSQFLSEYPGGMRCLRASASVALGVGADFLCDEDGRVEVCVFGVEEDWRRRLGGVSYCGVTSGSSLYVYAEWA